MKRSRMLTICLALTIGIILIGQFYNISNIPGGLNAFDPWYHLHITHEIIEYENYSGYISNATSKYPVDYITLLHPFSAGYTLVTGVSPYHFFKYSGVLLLLLISLGIYIVTERLTKDRRIAMISMLVFASIPYVHYRTTMNIPENYGLFFQSILFFLIFSKKDLRFLLLPLVAISYFHYRALALPVLLLILCIFLMPFKTSKIRSYRLELIKFTFLFLAIIFPILPRIANSYSYYLSHQVGGTGENLGWVINPALFETLSVTRYLSLLSLLPALLGLCGILILLLSLFFNRNTKREEKKLYLILLGYISLLFALTQGTKWGVHIKPYRFLGPLTLPLVFISSLGIKKMLHSNKKSNCFLKMIIPILTIPIICWNMFPNNYNTLHPEDKEAFKFIDHNYDSSSILVSYGRFYNYFSLSPKSEYNVDFTGEVFRMTSERDIMYLLKSKYGKQKTVIIVVPFAWRNTLRSVNPLFYKVFENYKIFDNGVRIYEFKT